MGHTRRWVTYLLFLPSLALAVQPNQGGEGLIGAAAFLHSRSCPWHPGRAGQRVCVGMGLLGGGNGRRRQGEKEHCPHHLRWQHDCIATKVATVGRGSVAPTRDGGVMSASSLAATMGWECEGRQRQEWNNGETRGDLAGSWQCDLR